MRLTFSVTMNQTQTHIMVIHLLLSLRPPSRPTSLTSLCLELLASSSQVAPLPDRASGASPVAYCNNIFPQQRRNPLPRRDKTSHFRSNCVENTNSVENQIWFYCSEFDQTDYFRTLSLWQQLADNRSSNLYSHKPAHWGPISQRWKWMLKKVVLTATPQATKYGSEQLHQHAQS